MKASSSITNLDTSNPSDNPNGTYKNESSLGAKDGTVLNKVALADLHAMIFKCVRDSGITVNDDFDNNTNGYQLHEAMFGTPWVTVSSFSNGAGTSTGPYAGGKSVRYRKVQGAEYVHLEGWSEPTASDNLTAFTLPVGFRPASPGIIPICANDGAITNMVYKTDGTISTEGSGAASLYFNVYLPLG